MALITKNQNQFVDNCNFVFFSFWPLCCLSFFDLWLFIIHFVSWNFSYIIFAWHKLDQIILGSKPEGIQRSVISNQTVYKIYLFWNLQFLDNYYENGGSSPSCIIILFQFSHLAIPFIPLVLSLNCFAFKSFDFEHTWWKSFHVH